VLTVLLQAERNGEAAQHAKGALAAAAGDGLRVDQASACACLTAAGCMRFLFFIIFF
jgi:hypothetical protein